MNPLLRRHAGSPTRAQEVRRWRRRSSSSLFCVLQVCKSIQNPLNSETTKYSYLPLSSPAKMNWQRLESCVAVWRRSSSPIPVAASSANQEPKRTQHPLFRLSWISKQSDRVAHSRSEPVSCSFMQRRRCEEIQINSVDSNTAQSKPKKTDSTCPG